MLLSDSTIQKLGAYLNGQISSQEFDLSCLDDSCLLFLMKYGKFGHGQEDRLRAEIQAELKRRTTKQSRYQ